MFSFSMPELVLILVIALVVFGPGKLPEVGKALGKGIQEFRKATTGETTTSDPAAKQESTVAHDTTVKVETKSEEKK
jgi:sec-independent protein translocase protein TatA